MVREKLKLETATVTLDRRRSAPLAGYSLLTVMGHDGGYCEPALRQALRTCTATLLVLSVLTNAYCSFAAAGDAPAQSTLAATTTLTPHVQVQNTLTNVGVIGSSASPAYPLKASANNRHLVDQNDVPFLMVGDSPQALIGNLSPMEAAHFIGESSTLRHQCVVDQSLVQ